MHEPLGGCERDADPQRRACALLLSTFALARMRSECPGANRDPILGAHEQKWIHSAQVNLVLSTRGTGAIRPAESRYNRRIGALSDETADAVVTSTR